MLSVSDLSVAIARVRILHDVAMLVPSGKTAGLIGRNGAGKTTLMRTIMGFVAPQSGRIEFEALDLTRTAPHKRASLGIGYMPEDRRLIPQLTVEENILLPIWATGQNELGGRLEWVYELIPEVSEFASRKAFQLSGGQQKLAALSRARANTTGSLTKMFTDVTRNPMRRSPLLPRDQRQAEEHDYDADLDRLPLSATIGGALLVFAVMAMLYWLGWFGGE